MQGKLLKNIITPIVVNCMTKLGIIMPIVGWAHILNLLNIFEFYTI